jgi:ribosomal-protein-alanine N-acetyltransferase
LTVKIGQNKTREISYVIRKAKEENIPAVMMVNLSSLPENYWYGFFLNVLQEWGDAFFVAEVDGNIVGYSMSRVEYTVDPVLIGVYNELDEGPTGILEKLKGFFKKPVRVGHLISIAVLKDYRRLGIGSALLENTINAMRNVYKTASLYLEVRVSNIPAIILYEKYGFRKARVIKQYYRDGEDAYVMVLRLRDPEEASEKDVDVLSI